MLTVLALCVPPLILVCTRNKLLDIRQSKREYAITYLIAIVALNWVMMMILFYGFQSSGNLFAKLSTYNMFAYKYIALAVAIAIVEPIIELLMRKYSNWQIGGKSCIKCNSNKKVKVQPATLLLYGLFLVLMILTISNKENYHMDEMCSYGLSNHQGSIVIDFEDGKTYTSSVEPYLEYLTVNEGNRFDYENVWENQSADVHPPLYYILLHTICSVFVGTYSKWYAGSINIVFALLTLYVLRKLIRSLTANNENICTIVSIAFVLSSGILSAVSFFRMYILAMFLMTLLTYILVKEIGEWRFDLRFFVNIFIVALMGALTHYYCIMYTVFVCAVFSIFLLIKKEWSSVVKFILTGALAGGTAYMVFPSMIKHMFSGYRGTEALDNLKQSPSEFWTRIKQFFGIIDEQVFGNNMVYIIVGIVLVVVIYCIVEKKDSRSISNRLLNVLNSDSDTARILAMRYALVFTSAIIYFLFVSKAAAYVTDRYMVPVYGVVFVGLTSIAIIVVQNIFKKKLVWTIIAIMMVAIVVGEWKNVGWSYLYKSSVTFLQATEKYTDVDCLYIYDVVWNTQPSFMEVQNYKSITFLKNENLDALSTLEISNENQLMVMIIGNKEEILEKILKTYSQLNMYEEIGSFGYATTYYLYAK